jgi:ferredoxin
VKVTVDPKLCQGYGNCIKTAPEVFELDDATGLSRVILPDPPPELHAAVAEAVRTCPMQAIEADADP